MVQLNYIKGGAFMLQIVPISHLKNTSEISEMCHSTKEPIFITKNGYGDMVLMSMENYERMMSCQKFIRSWRSRRAR